MNKLKRFIPIFCFVTVLAAYLFGQFAFKHGDSNANFSTQEKKLNSHYESIFQKSEFKSFKGLDLNLKSEKAPIVILNFWASWCKPCLEEFDSLTKLRKKYSTDQIKIIGINTDVEKQKAEITKTMKKYNLNFSIVPDESGKISNDFMVEAIPVSIIFNKGKVYQVSRGQKDFYSEEVLENFDSLLKL
jgi:thiol-disulfide isomerase/thioredoxin